MSNMRIISMKKYISFILVAIIAGGVGFGGGMSYANSRQQKNTFAMQQGGENFRNGGQGMRQGVRGGLGGAVSGEILTKDDKSLTVKLRDGGSKLIFLSKTTTISKPTEMSLDSLVLGDTVVIMGQANDDGSVTANSIQVRPTMQQDTPKQ